MLGWKAPGPSTQTSDKLAYPNDRCARWFGQLQAADPDAENLDEIVEGDRKEIEADAVEQWEDR
eukprot:1868067-Pyramimonas_sp.AAC.2